MSQPNYERRGFFGACAAAIGVAAVFGRKNTNAKDVSGPVDGELRMVDEPDGLTFNLQQFIRGQWRDVPSVDRKSARRI